MKKIKKLLVSFTFVFALLMIMPVILPGYSHTTNVQAATVTKSYTVFKGVTFRGTVSTAAPTKWTWKSSNTSVATVSYDTSTSNKPKITAVKAGTATITGTYGNNVVYYKITVPKISKTSLGLYKGSTYSLSITGSPTSVIWKSSDTSVATVNSSGKVTAKKAGTATITATATSVVGSTSLKKSFTCKVTVKNTVQQNLTTLKNKISKSSYVTSTGNHYIYRKTTSGTSTYKYTITYDQKNDRLKFSFTRKDSASKKAATISFYVYNTSKTYKIAPVISVTTTSGITFKTKTTLDRRTYTNSTDLAFSITSSNVSLTTARKTSMQSLSNSYLQMACKGWNKLVYSKTGMKLSNLGFTKYS